jgi:hypothetical protein
MSARRRLAFWPGETVRVRVTFADENGSNVPVSGVVFTSRNPAGATTALTPQAETSSTYYADVPVSHVGEWAVRATCSAPSTSAVEVSFTVRPSTVI